MFEAQSHARSTKARLRNPPNAVPDHGIDLRRQPRGFFFVGERPAPIKPVEPPVEIEEIILLDPPRDIINMLHVIGKVAFFYGLIPRDLTGDVRTAAIVWPRHVACYLCHEVLGRSYPQIGRAMGKRDHTTALNSVHQVKKYMLTDGELASDIAHLEAELIEEMEGEA